MSEWILSMAVPVPLLRCFDYLPPNDVLAADLQPGQRLLLPFGRRKLVGILVAVKTSSELPRQQLRAALSVLDAEPVLSPALLKLANWASDYYLQPLGEVFHTLLPSRLRSASAPAETGEWRWWALPAARDAAPRGALQSKLLQTLLAAGEAGLGAEQLRDFGVSWRAALARLQDLQWVTSRQLDSLPDAVTLTATPTSAAPELNHEQIAASTAIEAALGQFQRLLLAGITGSGKTEVYLQAVAAVLARGQQALILVPEIGLTPQLIKRFQNRFPLPLGVLHSGLSDKARHQVWQAASKGQLSLVIGTRSAVFTPMPRLGLLIVDEEHDASYKQQDGFRYHARDLAVMRAKLENFPIVLGSATPALESLHNVANGNYQCLQLSQRAGKASSPRLRLIDMRLHQQDGGLIPPMLQAIKQHLAANNQALLFLNRRGFAPVLICHACGWTAGCPRCDAKLTYHQGREQLRCHHCGYQTRKPGQCPDCQQSHLQLIGAGTERLETALSAAMPEARILRIDRDSTRNKGAFEQHLRAIRSGEPCVLIGTQMLAKGHDFPKVTLVGIIDVDGGLHSSDFRAPEMLAQQIIQVAGRAGRAEQPGEVLIQTHNPEHPLLLELLRQGYNGFARLALQERQAAQLPPYTRMALLRAEAHTAAAAQNFLHTLAAPWQAKPEPGVSLLGPVPAVMERLGGRYRAQLLIQSQHRTALHRLAKRLRLQLESDPEARKLRWSLDIDPIDLS